MSKAQRDKGRRGELEVLALFSDAGFEGELLYGQPELGGEQGDLTTTTGNWEVKRRASLPAWMRLADQVRGVFVRKDRGPWTVLIRADDLMHLLDNERELIGETEEWTTTAPSPQPSSPNSSASPAP